MHKPVMLHQLSEIESWFKLMWSIQKKCYGTKIEVSGDVRWLIALFSCIPQYINIEQQQKVNEIFTECLFYIHNKEYICRRMIVCYNVV